MCSCSTSYIDASAIPRGKKCEVLRSFYVSPGGKASPTKQHSDLIYDTVSKGEMIRITKNVKDGSYTNGYWLNTYGKIIGDHPLGSKEIRLDRIIENSKSKPQSPPYLEVR